MKIVSLKIVAVFIFLWCISLMVGSASAHRVNVFAWVDGDTVHVESKFAGGKKVKAGKIVVMDSQGNELLSGITDDQGEFSFTIPMRTDLKVVLIAGQGHRAEWTIPASEIEGLPLGTETTGTTETAKQSQKQNIVSEPFAEVKPVLSTPVLRLQDVEAVIETVLDRKLKPITKMLADVHHEGPTVRDIFGGIGYILGLVGIATYVHSRKKKE